MNKRFQKEIKNLYIQQTQKEVLENDYLIYYNDENINCVHSIIKAPRDSIYRHKFIRLDFTIPDNYPHSPPSVKFINFDGVRIHPNMYQDGKCCATILNTWGNDKFEKWTSSMGIETILLTFHSFLDNHPYMYEPGDRDDPSYSVYVQHQSWYSCLIRYLQYEKIDLFNTYMYSYLLSNIDSIFTDLEQLNDLYPYGCYNTRCFEVDNYIINYQKISDTLQQYYNYIDFTAKSKKIDENETFEEFINKEYRCYICFDTRIVGSVEETVVGSVEETDKNIKLNCTHCFHKDCLKDHIISNNNICPMCRTELTESDNNNLKENVLWIINPLTKRRVKIGSKTYNYLKDNDVI
jgi:ubiquitin-protein ligase